VGVRSLMDLKRTSFRVLENPTTCESAHGDFSFCRSLTISVDGCAVTVEGVLPTWFMRQVALECIKRVAGVAEVIDRIQVVRDAPHDPEPQFHPAFSKSATAQHMNEAEQIN